MMDNPVNRACKIDKATHETELEITVRFTADNTVEDVWQAEEEPVLMAVVNTFAEDEIDKS